MPESEMAGQRRVAGRYQLVRELGTGGMGTVWLAADELVGRQVAVKELRPLGLSPGEQEIFRQRALAEARSAARIEHHGAVTLFDILPATADDSAIYLIMEYLDGPTLAALIGRSGPQPSQQVASWGLELLSVLQAAHELGVIHRDVKPANIIITPRGQAKLTDFGIAHILGDPRLTRSGILGTQAYLAPELYDAAPITPAADLWSLGATLHAAACGRGPFDRDTAAATLRAVLVEDVPGVPGPPALTAAISGLLQRDPARRATVADAREQLQLAAQAGQPLQVPFQQAPFQQGQPQQGQPVRAQPLQAQPLQAQPLQAQPLQAQPQQAQPQQAQPQQAQPQQAQPQQAWMPGQAQTERNPAWQRQATTLSRPGSQAAAWEWIPEWSAAALGSRRHAFAAGHAPRILVFDWGIQITDWDGAPAGAVWADLQFRRASIAGGNYGYGLRLASGQSRAFGGKLRAARGQNPAQDPALVPQPGITVAVTAEQFGRLMDEHLVAAGLPGARSACDAGSRVPFGPFIVTRDGISADNKALSWSEVRSVEVSSTLEFVAVARIPAAGFHGSGGQLAAGDLVVPYSAVPNCSVFVALAGEILSRRPPASWPGTAS